MATASAPYGLRPVNMQGGQVDTHGIRLLPITSAFATSIFYGDPLKINVASGTVEKETGTTGLHLIGIFLGCEYQDTAMGLLHRQFWPASTVVKTNTTAYAYVLDDPDALFEVQADGAVAQTKLGLNANLVNPAAVAAQSITGNSKVQLATSGIANTATFPLRIVDFVRRPGSTVGDTYTDCVVRINTHLNREVLGAA